MNQTTSTMRPWVVGVLCLLFGAAVASIAWYKMWTYTAYDPLAGNVGEYADLLEKVNLPPDNDDDLASYVWGVSQDMVVFAGMRYDSMSARAQQSAVEGVTRIDKLAPQFEHVPFDKKRGYAAERSAEVRSCILAAQDNADADVSACVLSAVSDLYKPPSRDVAAR